jgi:hypothetical protein
MNCQSFENVIDDLAREQLIEARLREEALRHSDDCSTCAQRLADERDLTVSLRALAAEMNSAGAPERVENFLLAAFADRSSSPRLMRPKRWNYFYVAAAAVVLIAVGIGVVAWNSLVPSKIPEVTSGVPAATTPINTGEDSQVQTEVAQNKSPLPQPAPFHRPAKRNKPARTVPTAAVTETEVATDFMPIGYVSPTSLQDGGSVVRVELPRSTIVSMGFAVNMDRYGERVKADVLLGVDGLARAIRFVQ